MPVPLVNHRNWLRVAALSDHCIDAKGIMSTDLSFETRVQTLLNNPEADGNLTYNEEIGSGDTLSARMGNDEMEQVEIIDIKVDSGAEGHRPEVSEELDRELTERVDREYPQLPVDGLSFNKRIRLLCDKAEEYLEERGFEVEEVDEF